MRSTISERLEIVAKARARADKPVMVWLRESGRRPAPTVAEDLRAIRKLLEEQKQRRADETAFSSGGPVYRLVGRAI